MKLTAQIKEARDGRLDLRVLEMPELEVDVKRFQDIPEAVRQAAGRLTGRPETEFDVEVVY